VKSGANLLSPPSAAEEKQLGVQHLHESLRLACQVKIENHGDGASGDVSETGLTISGPGWGDRLKDALAALTHAERACLFAVQLDDEQGIPIPAKTLLDRARTDWFPKFLSQGNMVPAFQPIVDLRDPKVFGREALMRGRMGAVELRGAELVAAAEAHDALYSFDMRSRVAALERGLPKLPADEILFVNVDPRAVIDIEGSLRTVWPVVERCDMAPERVGLELTQPERYPDLRLLRTLVDAHRERGAVICVDNLFGGGDALTVVEALQPDIAKLDRSLCRGIELSPPRRRLVGALVEVAHELDCKVVGVGIERDTELDALIELGVDYGQGFYLGQPTEEMLPVDTRLIARAVR
jgi:EAL domain-containing protein (putative c-di-GMP-specific phosphodiesterase class I)